MELWKPIKNYEGFYEISNLGRIKSLDRIVKQWNGYQYVEYLKKGRIIRPIGKTSINGQYKIITLAKDGIKKKYRIHRLVAEHYCYNKNNLPEVDHKNGNTLDNRATNLRWVSKHNNIIYSKQRQKALNKKKFEKKYGEVKETVYYKGNKIINLETQKIFNSSREADVWLKEKLNISNDSDSNIRRSCRSGGLIPVHNYHFKYI